MNLALFDFDGTVTSKDSLADFLIFSQSKLKLVVGAVVLLPVLVLYKIGIMDNGKAKELVLSFFFRNVSFEDFQVTCNRYAKNKLTALIRQEALKRIQWHLANNDRVIIISASIENYVIPLSQELGVEAIATRLLFENQEFTGKYEGKNCYGPEKVERLKALLDPAEFAEIYAYGDSKGDREMLAIASQTHYKPFR